MTKTFDGSVIEMTEENVTVTEGASSLTLWFSSLSKAGLVADAAWNLNGIKAMDTWTKDRMLFCFGLAARMIANS